MNNDKYLFNYIYLLVADAEVAKALKTPGNLQELYTYVSYMKDKSGINGWTEQQHLLQVKSLIDPFPVTENLRQSLQRGQLHCYSYYNNIIFSINIIFIATDNENIVHETCTFISSHGMFICCG